MNLISPRPLAQTLSPVRRWPRPRKALNLAGTVCKWWRVSLFEGLQMTAQQLSHLHLNRFFSKHVHIFHILFDTCFDFLEYQYALLSLIQIEESLNRACIDRISKSCELLAQGTGKGCCMVHVRCCQGETRCPILFELQFLPRWVVPVTAFRWHSSPFAT